MKHSCQNCSKPIPLTKVFCSKDCKEAFFQRIAISIPKPFVKRLYFFCSEEEKEKEIFNFAKRHNWNKKIVKEKIEEAYNLYYECA